MEFEVVPLMATSSKLLSVKEKKMDKKIESDDFKNVYEEFLYEIQDVLEFVSHIIGQKSPGYTVIDLLFSYVPEPANDNWPVHETGHETGILSKTQEQVIHQLATII